MRTIEIHITDPLYAKLVAVAQKTSGADAPTQLQIDNTLALLAHHSLDRAYNHVIQPEPVTKPLDVPPALPKTKTYETSGYLNAPNL